MEAEVTCFLSVRLPGVPPPAWNRRRMGAYLGGFVDGCRGWMCVAGGERCACASQGLNEPLA